MTQHSAIDIGLIEAYKATDFTVDAQPPFTLRIGESNHQLAQLYLRHDISAAAFITAYNPYSEAVSDALNAALMRKLTRELTDLGLAFLSGSGQDRERQWPSEPSYLILGLPLSDAKLMGKQYQQNAIVWCGQDAIPQLILLR